MNLNKVMLIGNLTRDPEVRSTPNGTNVASFSIATNYVWRDQNGQKQEKAEFHNIVAWRKLADVCSQYLRKGSKVYLEGRLQTRDWDGQDGIKRYRTEIIADNMIMLDRAGATSGMMSRPATMSGGSAEPMMDIDDNIGEPNFQEEEIKVENIPF